MKYIQVIFFLGLIALGVFVGSYLGLVDGSGVFGGAILGGILGGLLYGIINRFRARGKSGFGPSSSRLDEEHQVNNSANTQARDTVVRKMQEGVLEERMRNKGSLPPF